VVALAGAAFAAHAADGRSTHAARRPGTWCGGVLWRQMTLSDRDRKRVSLEGTPTSISDIASLRPPAKIVPRRTTVFQRHTWQLQTVLDRYRIASNGEIVLILYSIQTGQYMNAYMPNPQCLSGRSRDKAGMLTARGGLRPCPQPIPLWNLIGATVDVAGVGFWNPSKTTRGALPNGAELRPLTNFKVVAGCGVG
jgi:hypothetical protein